MDWVEGHVGVSSNDHVKNRKMNIHTPAKIFHAVRMVLLLTLIRFFAMITILLVVLL